MFSQTVIILALAISHVICEPRCSGTPRMYNGLPCASTARYSDYHRGACGCGIDQTDEQYTWNHAGFNMAANQFFFDTDMSTWCGDTCGQCFKLTTTGGYVDRFGDPVPAGQSHVFMVTNVCPDEWPFAKWCSQSKINGNINHYDYGAHFNLEDGAGQVRAIGWGDRNPEVTYERVDCDVSNRQDNRTASNSMFHTCACG